MKQIKKSNHTVEKQLRNQTILLRRKQIRIQTILLKQIRKSDHIIETNLKKKTILLK